MRKSFICGFLTLCCLFSAGCGPQVPPSETDTEPFVFTRENMPRLDGSTATVPMAEAVCCVVLGEAREDVQDLVQFNRTNTSFVNLMDGNADLLIVGEPNETVLAEKDSRGFAWEMEPFANDAFVFVVNEDNPVESLTLEQIRGIYTGSITNWKELGGDDLPIIPLQRNESAGSQGLMKKLVMGDTPLMEAPKDYVIEAMGALMEAVKSYDSSPGAIGYSVYYYAEEMKMAQGLKLLSVEGVSPSPETIRGGEYPLLNPMYVVLPADTTEDAPSRILFDWILSDEGQKLAAHEGYVSIKAVEE